MKLYVTEYLCSGACAGSPFPDSLLDEGRAMWAALLCDLQAADGVELVTTCDTRLQPPAIPELQVHWVDNPAKERDLFEQLAQVADGVIVIAPELEGVLERRVNLLRDWGKGQLMSTPSAVAVTADKWKFHQLCRRESFRCPDTWLLADDPFPAAPPCDFPCLVKPRLGAGTTATYRVSSQSEWESLRSRHAELVLWPALVQTFEQGVPHSICCIIDPQAGVPLWLPLGQQCYSGLTYTGGLIPSHVPRNREIHNLACAILAAIPGLKGYIGIDLLVDPLGQAPPVVLEVNPRLTTSYLGYRTLATTSFAPWILGHENKPELNWYPHGVRFDTHGQTTLSR